jgi:hypothetical protein
MKKEVMLKKSDEVIIDRGDGVMSDGYVRRASKHGLWADVLFYDADGNVHVERRLQCSLQKIGKA